MEEGGLAKIAIINPRQKNTSENFQGADPNPGLKESHPHSVKGSSHSQVAIV